MFNIILEKLYQYNGRIFFQFFIIFSIRKNMNIQHFFSWKSFKDSIWDIQFVMVKEHFCFFMITFCFTLFFLCTNNKEPCKFGDDTRKKIIFEITKFYINSVCWTCMQPSNFQHSKQLWRWQTLETLCWFPRVNIRYCPCLHLTLLTSGCGSRW